MLCPPLGHFPPLRMNQTLALHYSLGAVLVVALVVGLPHAPLSILTVAAAAWLLGSLGATRLHELLRARLRSTHSLLCDVLPSHVVQDLLLTHEEEELECAGDDDIPAWFRSFSSASMPAFTFSPRRQSLDVKLVPGRPPYVPQSLDASERLSGGELPSPGTPPTSSSAALLDPPHDPSPISRLLRSQSFVQRILSSRTSSEPAPSSAARSGSLSSPQASRLVAGEEGGGGGGGGLSCAARSSPSAPEMRRPLASAMLPYCPGGGSSTSASSPTSAAARRRSSCCTSSLGALAAYAQAACSSPGGRSSPPRALSPAPQSSLPPSSAYSSRRSSTAGGPAGTSRDVPFAESHDCVTILFADIVGFTHFSQQVTCMKVLATLNDLYGRWDQLCSTMPVYKIQVIGDAYMCATGLMHDDEDHAATMLRFASAMLKECEQVIMPHNGQPVSVRIGVASGSVMGGLVGRIRRQFSVFGETVNTASRMEATSTAGAIHISEATYALVSHLPQFSWRRQVSEVKSMGLITTFVIDPEPPPSPPHPAPPPLILTSPASPPPPHAPLPPPPVAASSAPAGDLAPGGAAAADMSRSLSPLLAPAGLKAILTRPAMAVRQFTRLAPIRSHDSLDALSPSLHSGAAALEMLLAPLSAASSASSSFTESGSTNSRRCGAPPASAGGSPASAGEGRGLPPLAPTQGGPRRGRVERVVSTSTTAEVGSSLSSTWGSCKSLSLKHLAPPSPPPPHESVSQPSEHDTRHATGFLALPYSADSVAPLGGPLLPAAAAAADSPPPSPAGLRPWGRRHDKTLAPDL